MGYERAMIELKRPRPDGAPRPSQRVVFEHDPAVLLPLLARGERPRAVPRRRHVAIGFLGADGVDWRIEAASPHPDCAVSLAMSDRGSLPIATGS